MMALNHRLMIPLLSFSALFHLLGYGQDIQSNEPTYSTTSFDLGISHLLPNFQGHNLARLYFALEQRNLLLSKKDEYETTDQYKERVKREQEKPIDASLSIHSVFAFKSRSCKTSYDADKLVITVRFNLSHFMYPLFDRKKFPEDIKAIDWHFESKYLGSYIGTNAFGASVDVDRSQHISFDLALHNTDDFGTEELDDKDEPFAELLDLRAFVLKMALNAEDTRLLKPHIAALFVCSLTSPYVSKWEDYEPAKFDSPTSITFTTYYLHARLIEVWFYNESTGEVVHKIKED